MRRASAGRWQANAAWLVTDNDMKARSRVIVRNQSAGEGSISNRGSGSESNGLFDQRWRLMAKAPLRKGRMRSVRQRGLRDGGRITGCSADDDRFAQITLSRGLTNLGGLGAASATARGFSLLSAWEHEGVKVARARSQ